MVMLKPARRKRSTVAFSRLPLGMPSLSFMTVASVDGVGIVGAGFAFDPLVVFEPAVEAAFVTVVTDAGAERFDFDEERVVIAVGGDFFDDEAVAGAFAFHPQLVAGAAVEGDEAGFEVFAKASSFMKPTMRTRCEVAS